ncbi:uncharacterized protein TNCV_324511 [Trichonephila clavipes]|nr:uncharacterized protein TNCV_324511 [Trichonephila clavipes]
MSRTVENMISIYERNILRLIFEGIQKNGTWRRSNLELYQSYKESDIVNFIKIQGFKWAAHVIRMNEDHPTKKVFNARPIGTRRKGRQNLRWIDDLEKYLLVLRTRNWITLAGRRLDWKRPRPTLGCHVTEGGRKDITIQYRKKKLLI